MDWEYNYHTIRSTAFVVFTTPKKKKKNLKKVIICISGKSWTCVFMHIKKIVVRLEARKSSPKNQVEMFKPSQLWVRLRSHGYPGKKKNIIVFGLFV